MISIHVSARETTIHSSIFKSVYTDFNPRLRKGDDSLSTTPSSLQIYFNPRLRKGDDQYHLQPLRPYRHFNPRLRKGDDSAIFRRFWCRMKFQSTSPQGRRLLLQILLRDIHYYFNPRLRKGDDVVPHDNDVSPGHYFNPRLRKGDDLYNLPVS